MGPRARQPGATGTPTPNHPPVRIHLVMAARPDLTKVAPLRDGRTAARIAESLRNGTPRHP